MFQPLNSVYFLADPLSCPLDDIDLTAILNSWTETSDPKQQHTSADVSHYFKKATLNMYNLDEHV